MALKTVHTYVVHSVPPICTLIYMLISNTILMRRHVLILAIMVPLYSYSNYLAVAARGSPLYWFLTWEDYTSILICALIGTIFMSLFYLTAVIDEWITNNYDTQKCKTK